MTKLHGDSVAGRLTRLALLASTALAAPAAMAQAAAPEAQATAQAEAVDSDPNVIIVTAQKRSENLQNVPISIQAFSGEKLKQATVTRFDDYAKLLPSVSFQSFGPGQSQIYFRGVSSGANANGSHSGPQPTSALYLDEIPLTTIGGAPDLHVYDMARVEALSGPQGTLFGSSSLSGTLRLITNRPNPGKLEAGVDISATSFGRGANSSGGTAEGFINIPLSAHVALRASGFYERDGGYITNVFAQRTYDVTPASGVGTVPFTVNNARFAKKNFNDTEIWGGRAALRVELDDNWTVTPSVTYQDQRSHGTYLFDQKAGDLKVRDYTPERGTDEWYQAALSIEGKLGNWDVVYAGGYFQRNTDLLQDYSDYTVAYDRYVSPSYASFIDGAGNNIDPTQTYRGRDRYTKQSHELRISSPKNLPWKLVAGLFYQRQTDFISGDYIIPGLAAIPASPAVPTCGDNIFCTRVNRIDRDYAAFLDASYDILPSLTLNGGIRYFRTRNSLAGFSGFASNVTNDAACPPSNSYPCQLFDKTVREDGETHKINLTWKVDPDRLIYATWSTGFRPGGINRRIGVNPYRSDTLNNYEIGFKSQWFDHKLTVNFAGFIEEWKNLQYGLSSAGAIGVISTYNAGNARIKGVEGDFSARLGGLTLSGSGTFIDAKLTTAFCPIDATGNPDCSDPTLVAAPAGRRLPTQPRFKGNLSARYSFLAGPVAAYLQGAVNYQSSTLSYLTIQANGGEVLPPTNGFATADFALGGKLDHYSFELFVQNAFDSRGILSLNSACVPTICGAFARAYPTKPRLFGVKAGYRF